MGSDSVTINQKTYSLYELMTSIQSILGKTYAGRHYWIRCEVSRISLHSQTGHCYLEIIDKNDTSIVAQLKAMIWSDKYKSICQKFESATNTPLANGMKLLLCCTVSFHTLHGLSLTVIDIEPSFTLGEMARMKTNSIARLKSEGLFDLNKSRSLSVFPGRIAIVSVATSRGYKDFLTTIVHYQKKFAIRHTLFEAVLQGDNAIPSLTRAIREIISQKDQFDAIAIIRGGAGDAGLSCYDEYSLASVMAQSPLPIITGIGHATNETVAEMVAYKNCITPTAAASYLLEKFESLSFAIESNTQRLRDAISRICSNEKNLAHSAAERICMIVRNKMDFHKFTLTHLFTGLPLQTSRFLNSASNNVHQVIHFILNVKKFGTYQLVLSQLDQQINKLQDNARLKFVSAIEKITQLETQTITVKQQLKQNSIQLEHLSEKINLLDPVNTLKRGYSITRYKNTALIDPHDAPEGAVIETQLAGGVITSTINK